MNAPRLLMTESLCKAKDGYPMLDQVSLEFAKGQACGIIFDARDRLNLLIDILGGAEREDSGHISYGTKALSSRERLRSVGVSRERTALVEKLSVLDNIFLGSVRRYSRFGILDTSLMKRKALEILKRLELSVAPETRLEAVNPASRFLVDISRTIAKDAAYYVFDSVTRAMSARQYEAFVDLVRDLKSRGKGVIVVPVDAEDIRNLVDCLYLLKGSRLIEIQNVREMTDDELNELFLSSGKKGFKHINDPIYKARARIEERVREKDIDFREIADSLFMGYDNFRRRFKLQVGLSPHQYFLKLKVDKAKELLLFTDLEVKEIAEQVGFVDPYYFSHVFKERESLSPLKFRNASPR